MEWAILEDINENLDVMKVSCFFCCEDAILLIADAAVNFALQKLEARRSSILSNDLHTNLSKRMKQRRLKVASARNMGL